VAFQMAETVTSVIDGHMIERGRTRDKRKI
jgi:hypothetical protein